MPEELKKDVLLLFYVVQEAVNAFVEEQDRVNDVLVPQAAFRLMRHEHERVYARLRPAGLAGLGRSSR